MCNDILISILFKIMKRFFSFQFLPLSIQRKLSCVTRILRTIYSSTNTCNSRVPISWLKGYFFDASLMNHPARPDTHSWNLYAAIAVATRNRRQREVMTDCVWAGNVCMRFRKKKKKRNRSLENHLREKSTSKERKSEKKKRRQRPTKAIKWKKWQRGLFHDSARRNGSLFNG